MAFRGGPRNHRAGQSSRWQALSDTDSSIDALAESLCEAIQLCDTGKVQSLLLRRLPQEVITTEVSGLDSQRHLTALHYAVEQCSPDGVEILKLLLQESLDKEALETVSHGQIRRQRQTRRGQSRLILEFEGYTPLCWACLSGNVSAVRALLLVGANPNSQESFDKTTPLIAVSSRSIEGRSSHDQAQESRIVTALIKAGADVTLQDEHGSTALHYLLAQEHQLATAQRILAKTVKPIKATNKNGWNLLHCCVSYIRSEEVESCIRSVIRNNESTVREKNKHNENALELAIAIGNEEAKAVLQELPQEPVSRVRQQPSRWAPSINLDDPRPASIGPELATKTPVIHEIDSTSRSESEEKSVHQKVPSVKSFGFSPPVTTQSNVPSDLSSSLSPLPSQSSIPAPAPATSLSSSGPSAEDALLKNSVYCRPFPDGWNMPFRSAKRSQEKPVADPTTSTPRVQPLFPIQYPPFGETPKSKTSYLENTAFASTQSEQDASTTLPRARPAQPIQLPTFGPTSRLRTISPKDAILDYVRSEEEAKIPLFPPIHHQSKPISPINSSLESQTPRPSLPSGADNEISANAQAQKSDDPHNGNLMKPKDVASVEQEKFDSFNPRDSPISFLKDDGAAVLEDWKRHRGAVSLVSSTQMQMRISRDRSRFGDERYPPKYENTITHYIKAEIARMSGNLSTAFSQRQILFQECLRLHKSINTRILEAAVLLTIDYYLMQDRRKEADLVETVLYPANGKVLGGNPWIAIGAMQDIYKDPRVYEKYGESGWHIKFRPIILHACMAYFQLPSAAISVLSPEPSNEEYEEVLSSFLDKTTTHAREHRILNLFNVPILVRVIIDRFKRMRFSRWKMVPPEQWTMMLTTMWRFLNLIIVDKFSDDAGILISYIERYGWSGIEFGCFDQLLYPEVFSLAQEKGYARKTAFSKKVQWP